MKKHAKVIDSTITPKGEFIATLMFNGKAPVNGTTVQVKWGKARSRDQNALYWTWLSWLIDEGGMKDQGYCFKDELHEALKNRLLCKKIKSAGGFITLQIKSTTELKTDEFVDYMEQAEHLLREYCGVDCTPFWEEYRDIYSKY